MKYTRKEVQKILNVSQSTLKNIEKRKQLKALLLKKGYKLKQRIKKGRNVYYSLDHINASSSKYTKKLKNEELADNIIKYAFNISKSKEFKLYWKTRVRNTNKPLTLEIISNKSNVTSSTIRNWDSKLIDKNIINRDGYFYLRIDRETGTIEETSVDEYKSFWRNKSYLLALSRLQTKYKQGKITLTELQLASMDLASIINAIENKYIIKVKKYRLVEDNKLYIDLNNLI